MDEWADGKMGGCVNVCLGGWKEVRMYRQMEK